ncbi:hypothetical protein Taro_039762 [Colocasia esculenta]|uniref:Btz domain-containing protein n=1 Tax=Colocasia esculenta TaxID=4460 RepID=A0A843WN66_COLES|nr:hypothetical protein [Colocasia esculenta]
MAEASPSSGAAAAPPVAEEEPEYESDPEDALLPSMRRREASDDEEEAERSSEGEAGPTRAGRRIGSEEDLDGQGGDSAYEEEEEEEFEAEEDVEEDVGEDEELLEEEAVAYADGGEGGHGGDAGREGIPAEGLESGPDGQGLSEENGDYHANHQAEGEERKQNEPFAVPTAGAFYMHDDRFRENGGGRHRIPAMKGTVPRNMKGILLAERDVLDIVCLIGSVVADFEHDSAGHYEASATVVAEAVQSNLGPSISPSTFSSCFSMYLLESNCHYSRSRTKIGRKLWESKDDKKWVHDRFEEMNIQEARKEERTSKGRFRGRGRNHGMDQGYVRGNKPPSYDDRSRAYDGRSRAYKNDRAQPYDDSGNQNRAPKFVRGRGSRHYEPLPKNNGEQPATQCKQSGKSRDVASNIAVPRKSSNISNVQPEPVQQQKHVFASSLSSASPPFYPSGSSNQDMSASSKRDAQSANNNQNVSSSFIEDNLSPSHTGAILSGKAVLDSLVQDGYFVDDFAPPVNGKSLPSLQLQLSSSPPICTTQSSQLRVQGRGKAMAGHLSYQPSTSANQLGRGTVQTQLPAAQRPLQTSLQLSLRPLSQPSVQRPGGPQHPSSSQAQLTTMTEVVEAESPCGSGKLVTTVSGKGKTSTQGNGRGSFMYSGAQVIGGTGTMGLTHGDQNFPATPALLPVMQFGGQHPGGIGVPAVGMALPGYVAQGFGNSEMTWYAIFLCIFA